MEGALGALPLAVTSDGARRLLTTTELVILNPAVNALFEEPNALIVLVRVCGGVGGQPPALPGKAER